MRSLRRTHERLEFRIEILRNSVCLGGNAKQIFDAEYVDLNGWSEDLRRQLCIPKHHNMYEHRCDNLKSQLLVLRHRGRLVIRGCTSVRYIWARKVSLLMEVRFAV
jgi:hypothetical protein